MSASHQKRTKADAPVQAIHTKTNKPAFSIPVVLAIVFARDNDGRALAFRWLIILARRAVLLCSGFESAIATALSATLSSLSIGKAKDAVATKEKKLDSLFDPLYSHLLVQNVNADADQACALSVVLRVVFLADEEGFATFATGFAPAPATSDLYDVRPSQRNGYGLQWQAQPKPRKRETRSLQRACCRLV
jgi:hypothetical protein